MDKNKPDEKRSIILDNFRGIAVLLVLADHLYLIDKDAFTNPILKVVRYGMTFMVRGGWVGVDLFFVLSGFLVSSLIYNEYQTENKFSAKRFLIRRGFKLYPSFFFFILITFIVEKLILHSAPNYNLVSYIKDIFFIHNYLGGRFGHSWSLDVEEHFYILLSLFFIYLISIKTISFKILKNTYIYLLVLALVSRFIPYFLFNDHNSYYSQTHARVDCLFLGVLLAYVYHYERSKFDFIIKNRPILMIVALLLIASNFIFKRTFSPIHLITLSTDSMCFGLLIILGLTYNVRFLKSKFLSFVGKNSYAIYLWHPFINSYILMFLFSTKLDEASVHTTSKKLWVVYVLLYYGLSLLAGVVFTYTIEVPFLKLRNRLFPSKTKVKIITAN